MYDVYENMCKYNICCIIGMFLLNHPVTRSGTRYQVMGWLRLVGSSKCQVSFAEYSLFYRALLQKRYVILRSTIPSYGVAMISRLLKNTGLFCKRAL